MRFTVAETAKELKTRRKKQVIGRENWQPYGSRFSTKAAEKKYFTTVVRHKMRSVS
jgi:hypothetical protein